MMMVIALCDKNKQTKANKPTKERGQVVGFFFGQPILESLNMHGQSENKQTLTCIGTCLVVNSIGTEFTAYQRVSLYTAGNTERPKLPSGGSLTE